MLNFIKCFCYLITISILSFLIGRCLPSSWFHAEQFPYRSFRFEKDGSIYNALHIRKWQNKLPDMSKLFPKLMPSKSLKGDMKYQLPLMLRETCVAEFVHMLLCIASLYCRRLYPGSGGVIIICIYIVVFNLPYILIQRYNRPRLKRINDKQHTAKK